MSEWPDDWFRGRTPAPGSGSPGLGSPGSADPTAHLTPGGARGPGDDGPTGSWPAQPPVSRTGRGRASGGTSQPGEARRSQATGRGGSSGPGSPGRTGTRRWLRPRRIIGILAVLVALVLIAGVGTYFYLNSKLSRSDVLVDYSGRPAPGSGQNWLIAGSDTRQGLTRKQERKFHTGFDVSGGRSDTVMLLHIPAGGGNPLLISLPRDSYVDIPGYGYNKLNAAYSFGGPALLAKTVQDVTGLYINHYMGIGFGGFVNVVNDVGGVQMCFKHSLYDRASGVHLKKGCHNMSGGQALAYVRDRHSFTDQDLQRIQDQRVFLAALLRKVTSSGVMLNPFTSIPAAIGIAHTVSVDQNTSLYQLLQVAFAMRHPETTTVPIANSNYLTSAGDSVLWNQTQAKRLFTDLRTGAPVPKYLITGSSQAG